MDRIGMLLLLGVFTHGRSRRRVLDIAAQPFGLGLQIARLGDARGAAGGVLVPGQRSLRGDGIFTIPELVVRLRLSSAPSFLAWVVAWFSAPVPMRSM
jgi:hypothetical protein